MYLTQLMKDLLDVYTNAFTALFLHSLTLQVVNPDKLTYLVQLAMFTYIHSPHNLLQAPHTYAT